MFFKNLNILINRKEKKYFFVITILLFISSILETVGIAIFLPIINLVFNNSLADNFWIQNLNNFFQIDILNLNLILLSLLLIFFIKNFLFLFFMFIRIKIINYYRQQKKIKLLKIYLNLDYSKFTNREKSELLRNLYHEVDNFTENFVMPIIEFIYIFFILINVLFFLVIYDAKITSFFILSLISFFFIFYFITKKRLLMYGSDRAKYSKILLRKIPDAFKGYIEIKLFDLKTKVIDEFMKYQRRLDRIKIPQSIIANIPRSFLELFVITGFTILLAYKFDSNDNILLTVAKLSIYAVVIIKIFPYINSISNIFSRIMRGFTSYNILANEFKDSKMNNMEHLEVINEKIKEIKFSEVHFDYFDDNLKKINILENVDLKIKSNDFIGIIGKSGSGKTTLLNLLIGLLKPTKGNIKLNDKKLNEINLEKLYHKFSYIPQEPFFLYDTVKSNIVSSDISKLVDNKKIIDILKRTKLDNRFVQNGNISNEFIGENASNLSGGEKQRLAIARAIYSDCEVMILDEITNKLDLETRKEIIDLISSFKNSKTVIIVSHDQDTIEKCNNVFELKNKKLIKKI